jgi:spore coat protein A, manganese oxidase
MKSLKSRIPQPMSKLEELRWKTKLNIPQKITLKKKFTKIFIGEVADHIFFHDDTGSGKPDIKGRMWGYGIDPAKLTSPGLTLEATEYQTTRVKWVNRLPSHHPFVEPPRELRSPGMMSRYDVGHTVVHLHGAHVPWTSDGYSMRVSRGMGNPTNRKTVLRSGEREIFKYPNTQHGGATLWYHDHTMDSTSMNVYAGLAGAYLLRHRRENQLASLPKGNYEIPLIIQDRSFVQDDTGKVELLYGDANFLASYSGLDLITGSIDQTARAKFRNLFFSGDKDSQPSPEFKGQVICVNGKIWPFLKVEPRPYRFRIVNGSNSRMYVLRLSNSTIDPFSAKAAISLLQIGSDGGLFPKCVEFDGDGSVLPEDITKHFLVLAPGERADVIIDFSEKTSGESFYLTNHATKNSPLGNGGDDTNMGTTDGILKFVIKNTTTPITFDQKQLNTDLKSIALSWQPKLNIGIPPNPTRQYVIQEFPIPLTTAIPPNIPKGWKAITFQQDINNPEIPGLLWGGEPPMVGGVPIIGGVPNGGPQPDLALPPHQLGTKIELWEFYNISPDVHPIHLHHSSVQIHSRVTLSNPISQTRKGTFGDNVDLNEQGWKDTVRVNPGELTTILVRFDDQGDKCHDYTGHYVWHCHILEHEDMGMMRPLEIKK